MSGKTHIAWTEATWNPTIGCTRVSSGCDKCYAFALHDQRYAAWKAGRFPTAPEQYHKPFSASYTLPGADAPQGVQLLAERLTDPLKWRKPRLVFVNSMSDLWHETVPDEFIRQVFAVMGEARQHTFQVLTKRPERMRDFMSDLVAEGDFATLTGDTDTPFPWPNVWLGVSVENQRAADERIPLLLQTPAAVRFLSCEPLLGPVDLIGDPNDGVYGPIWTKRSVQTRTDYGTGVEWDVELESGIHWVIVGGESGQHFRPMDPAWARSLRDQCQAAGVPFFYKQGSGLRPGMNRELDGRLWEEMPALTAARDREAVMA